MLGSVKTTAQQTEIKSKCLCVSGTYLLGNVKTDFQETETMRMPICVTTFLQ